MAQKPGKEVEVCAYDKDVSPGFLYDFATKEYSPGGAGLAINIEECIPEYKVKIMSKEDLNSLENSKVYRFQDIDVTKYSDLVLVKGEKICEYRGNVEPHTVYGVVSSTYYKLYIDILICFNNKLEEGAVESLERYIESVIGMKRSGDIFQNNVEGTGVHQPGTSVAFIPSCINSTFFIGYIYEREKTTTVYSIKYALEEFCNYLVHSETMKFPVCCKIKCPLNTDSEPPIVKPSQRTELPDLHYSRGKAKGSNSISLSQHNDTAVKELGKNKLPNTTDAHCLRTKKTFSGKQFDEREQKFVGCHVSGRKPLYHKGCEIRYTSEFPQDVTGSNSSNKDVCLPSSQNLKPECDRLKGSDELKSRSFTVRDLDVGKQFQEKPIFSLSHNDGMNNSEKHGSLNKSQSKFEQEPVDPQGISRKTNLLEVNKSTEEYLPKIIMPVKELEVCGVIRKFYGATPKAEGKTVILLGACGSGKTTLVNFIANYFCGNKTAVDKLIKVVMNSNDFKGQTTQITCYTFCVSENDSPLTIIDTPGLNDSSGAEVHDQVQALKTFLANAGSQNLKIHAIGFVAQAHIVRLTSSERLVMDYISSLFGKEVANHVISLVTFSDNQDSPPVVEAINNYKMKCTVFLKFNNSALNSNKEEEIDELDKIYWRIGCKSLKKLIKLLENLPPLSFKCLKDEIYVTEFLKVAERDLRTEVMGFVNHHQKNKVISKEILDNAERVLTLAEVVRELRCIDASECTTVDDILLSYVEEICNMNNCSLSSREYMKLLSLSPSRPLLKAGLAIISSVAPLYNSLKHNFTWQKEPPSGVLFCHNCKEDHVLKRTESSKWSFRTNKNITYKCSKCKCAGGLHGVRATEDEKLKIAKSDRVTPDKLLHHTRSSIVKVLQDLCLPEYKIHEDYYINCLKCMAKQEAQKFCVELLNIKLTDQPIASSHNTRAMHTSHWH